MLQRQSVFLVEQIRLDIDALFIVTQQLVARSQIFKAATVLGTQESPTLPG